MTRGGVVLSHASTVVGPLVTPAENPEELAALVESMQPGCVATPVWETPTGWRSDDGRTVEQILAAFQ